MESLLNEGQYLSIATPVDFEICIKRSRFIASLRSVSNRSEFEENLRAINVQYPKATHYCWAYRFVGNPVTEHSTDDGEPAGSAGRPMLGALKKNSLLNIMAVVTRYYGGIKLGVSGLIYAYLDATTQAILKTEKIVREPMASFGFSCSYEMYNLLCEILKRRQVSSGDIEANFGEKIFGEFKISIREIVKLQNEIDEIKYRGYLIYQKK